MSPLSVSDTCLSALILFDVGVSSSDKRPDPWKKKQVPALYRDTAGHRGG